MSKELIEYTKKRLHEEQMDRWQNPDNEREPLTSEKIYCDFLKNKGK